MLRRPVPSGRYGDKELVFQDFEPPVRFGFYNNS
jgi:hypothetical protein